jgi:hypothetical protein
MKTPLPKFDPSELLLSVKDFLQSYNTTIPASFPKASLLLLQKYRDEHEPFFKHKDQWSLAEHRKKIMDWLPLNKEDKVI